MSQSTSSLLPHDILYKIIDAVATNGRNRPTLKHCNLVSTSFYLHGRRHLYRNIHLSVPALDDPASDEIWGKFSRLTELLNYNGGLDRLASIVQAVIVSISQPSFTISHAEQDDFNRKAERHTQQLQTYLPQLFNQLHSELYGIEEFRFMHLVPGMVWQDLKPEMQLSLRNLAHSPHLKKLVLWNLEYFPLDLIVNPSLTSLGIHQAGSSLTSRIDFHRFPSQTTPIDPTFFSSLKSLSSDFSFPFYRLVKDDDDGTSGIFPPFDGLRTLYVSVSSASKITSAHVQRLLDQNYFLEDLYLSFNYTDPTAESFRSFDFSNCSSLRKLNLRVWSDSPGTGGLSVVLLLLRKTSVVRNLTQLELCFRVLPADVVHPSSDPNWVQLDQAISSKQFPSLRRVVLELQVIVDYNDRPNFDLGSWKEQVTPLVLKALPSVVDRPQLRLDLDFDYVHMVL